MPSDDEEDDEQTLPASGPTVEGAPLSRVASRLSWPLQQSEVVRREGDVTIRTPDGPQQLGAILEDVSVSYFATEEEFTDAVRAVIGSGPVPTTESTEEQ